MSRKKIIYAVVAIACLLAIGVIANVSRNPSTNTINDGKEPESQGLSLVRFSGDSKFDTLLATPQLRAAKKELSTYIHMKYGQKTYTATIDKTTLQDNGEIRLTISADSQKPFEAIIQPGQEQMTISVPSDNYQKSIRQETILREYGVY